MIISPPLPQSQPVAAYPRDKEATPEPIIASMGGRPQAARTAPPLPLIPPRLLIELDEASDRFVQTIVDAGKQTVLRRFPSEGQIAFSRGVSAYVEALRRT